MLSLFRRKDTAAPSPDAVSSASATTPDADGSYRILTARQLLSVTQADRHLHSLRELSEFPEEVFDKFVMPALHSFAERVQLAPASEAHHHAHPGGLLKHTVEVMENALKRRLAAMLPPGAHVEDIKPKAMVWTYGVIAAVLLHDIGKVLTDYNFELVHRGGKREPWSPLGGTMAETGAKRYTFKFNRGRSYNDHQTAGMSMFSIILPRAATGWIGQERQLMQAITAICAGDKDGAGLLGKIVQQSDMESSGASFATPQPGGAPAQMVSAREVPLIDKLKHGLRDLIIGGHVICSRSGAPAFYQPGEGGGTLWVVVPTIMAELRTFLKEHRQQTISVKNNQIYDTLSTAGIAINASEERSVHKVAFTGKDNAYNLELSCLKLNAGMIFDDNEYPAPFEGTVAPLTDAKSAGKTAKKPQSSASDDDSEETGKADSGTIVVQHTLTEEQMIPAAARAPAPAPAWQTPQADRRPKRGQRSGNSGKGQRGDGGAAEAGGRRTRDDSERSAAAGRDDAQPKKDVRRRTIPQGAAGLSEFPNIHDDALKLLSWLTTNLETGHIKHNAPKAPVHFVDEGRMFLVSPRVFKEYAKFRGDASEEGWKKFQRALTGSNMEQSADLPPKPKRLCLLGNNGRYLHKYRLAVETKPGTLQSAELNGVLVREEIVRRIITNPPPANIVLEKIS